MRNVSILQTSISQSPAFQSIPADAHSVTSAYESLFTVQGAQIIAQHMHVIGLACVTLNLTRLMSLYTRRDIDIIKLPFRCSPFGEMVLWLVRWATSNAVFILQHHVIQLDSLPPVTAWLFQFGLSEKTLTSHPINILSSKHHVKFSAACNYIRLKFDK